MRNPCQCLVKNRKLLAKIACGRSGRHCVVSGQSYNVRLVLCSRHRAKEGRRYRVEIVAREQLRNRRASARFSDIVRAVDRVMPATSGDFMEGL